MTVDELIDAFQAAWSSRLRSAFASCCAVDVHYEDPLSGGALEGLEALADHAARLWAAFPDVRVERAGARLTGGAAHQYVAAPCRLVATHAGDLPRLPATGRPLSVHAVLYCELDPDRERLWRVRAFFDPYDAGVQLGVLPRHGTIGERALLMLRGFGIRG
ncbi:MAG TPA: ester cyclase [Capillimicrobium sp.]|nr:ester cyclase [Capillimicrobium sp.]